MSPGPGVLFPPIYMVDSRSAWFRKYLHLSVRGLGWGRAQASERRQLERDTSLKPQARGVRSQTRHLSKREMELRSGSMPGLSVGTGCPRWGCAVSSPGRAA